MVYIVLLIIVLAMYLSLRNRIDNLENVIKSQSYPIQQQKENKSQDYIGRLSTDIKIQDNTSFSASSDEILQPLLLWLKIDWPMKLGSLLIIIGIGWFVSYAFIHNWVSPLGRILLGLICGLLVLALAHTKFNKNTKQAVVLIGLGSAIELATIYSSVEVYNLISVPLALVAVSVIVFYLALISYFHNIQTLAYLSLFIGSFAPTVVTTSPINHNFFLFSPYQLIVITGIILLAIVMRWKGLIAMSVGVMILHSFINLASLDYLKIRPTDFEYLTFAFTFFLLFFFSGLFILIRSKKLQEIDVISVFLTLIYIVYWIALFSPEHTKSLLVIICAIPFFLGSYILYKYHSNKISTYVYSSATAILIALAASFELKGPVFIIALTLLISYYSKITYFILKNKRYGANIMFFVLIPMLLAYDNFFSDSAYKGIFNIDFLVIGLFVFVWYYAIYFYKSTSAKADLNEDSDDSLRLKLYGYIGTISLFILIWRLTHGLFYPYDTFARVTALLIYSVIGIASYLQGKLKQLPYFHTLGAVIIIGVTLRLLFSEIAYMSDEGKIIAYIFTGVIFVSSIYFEKIVTPSK